MIRVGLIGLGQRGSNILKQVLLERDDVVVTAVSDVYQDRMEQAQEMIKDRKNVQAAAYADYRALLQAPDVDAVLVMSSWDTHVKIAVEAMLAQKAVGMEVGGCYDLEECWQLVHTWEETRVPFMFLENCCYGRNELMVLNMVRQGVLGEVIHCAGGYRHDLRNEVATGEENRHYRLKNYLHRNAENYPTHELGPIAKVLKINHGNRMLSLVSVASASRGMEAYIAREENVNSKLKGRRFAQGDIVNTLITCANGETISLVLDTTLPRPYSRDFAVHGTAGMYQEQNNSLFLDGEHNSFDFSWQEKWNNFEQYREQYEHPIWREYLNAGVKGGHDGIDWLVLDAFFQSLKEGTAMPIDVYDAASWMAVTALSEQSILQGGAPVAIPDFTLGKWLSEDKQNKGKYTLDD